MGIIQKEISGTIQFSLGDPRVGFITITDIMVTNDSSITKIYVPSLGQKPREGTGMETSDRSKGYLCNELTKRMAIREISELILELDDSLECGNKVERIISEINK